MFNLLKILFNKKTLPYQLSEEEESSLLKLSQEKSVQINGGNFIIKKIEELPNGEKHYFFDNRVLIFKDKKINFAIVKPTRHGTGWWPQKIESIKF
ncbi:MAG: hypothetical protein UX09_C0010G0014 [Candidatus Uhrbacteria bacterium GW2011_GWE2_45_35]|uniref:Uncharacterized protein n=1 Tax=Candidatus Uhrbacteria bacterium GW2011_GWE2_45_35 TaxID=1618993 RepID=A0A0G1QJK4_9BACT|nr:MAG: hypothetical protein UX09_C0010G0014 [Candidatus Uhrbacteria bacterium GW2011_GWE2_45_35]HBR80783.1 hypothetical protein [Candidatus Uhrbacteria bacterium]HCU31850.1 hypothetical protein [Candidatus Uhrbacteria bacterium]